VSLSGDTGDAQAAIAARQEQSLAVILGYARAGVRTSSKIFEVTMRWRIGHKPKSPRGRAANELVSPPRQAHVTYMGEV